MAGTTQFGPKPIFTTSGASMASNATSMVIYMPDYSGISFGFSWSGSSPVGTLSVQVSNDYTLDGSGNQQNAGTWTTLPFQVSGSYVTSVAVSGNNGNGFIDIGNIHALAMRVVYTASSGSGIIFGTAVGKLF